jgi:hypothetical protein
MGMSVTWCKHCGNALSCETHDAHRHEHDYNHAHEHTDEKDRNFHDHDHTYHGECDECKSQENMA